MIDCVSARVEVRFLKIPAIATFIEGLFKYKQVFKPEIFLTKRTVVLILLIKPLLYNQMACVASGIARVKILLDAPPKVSFACAYNTA